MVKHESDYRDFIKRQGVGKKDRVASSPDSYVKYLTAVSRLLNSTVCPKLLRTLKDVETIKQQLAGKRKPKTISNYGSAMKQYVAMVAALGL